MPVLNLQERPKYEKIEIVMPDGKKFTVKPVSFSLYCDVMADDRKDENVFERLLKDLARVLGVKSADLAEYPMQAIMESNVYVHEELRKQSSASDPTPAEGKK